MKALWRWIGKGIGWVVRHPEVADAVIGAIANRPAQGPPSPKVDPPAVPTRD